jgi:hypothetical protein
MAYRLVTRTPVVCIDELDPSEIDDSWFPPYRYHTFDPDWHYLCEYAIANLIDGEDIIVDDVFIPGALAVENPTTPGWQLIREALKKHGIELPEKCPADWD